MTNCQGTTALYSAKKANCFEFESSFDITSQKSINWKNWKCYSYQMLGTQAGCGPVGCRSVPQCAPANPGFHYIEDRDLQVRLGEAWFSSQVQTDSHSTVRVMVSSGFCSLRCLPLLPRFEMRYLYGQAQGSSLLWNYTGINCYFPVLTDLGQQWGRLQVLIQLDTVNARLVCQDPMCSLTWVGSCH
jgi:hypothetical protein